VVAIDRSSAFGGASVRPRIVSKKVSIVETWDHRWKQSVIGLEPDMASSGRSAEFGAVQIPAVGSASQVMMRRPQRLGCPSDHQVQLPVRWLEQTPCRIRQTVGASETSIKVWVWLSSLLLLWTAETISRMRSPSRVRVTMSNIIIRLPTSATRRRI